VALHYYDECLHESRMREIRTSGSTRGEGRCCCLTSFPPLLYRLRVFAVKGEKCPRLRLTQ